MSIAIAVVLKPSRIMRYCAILFSLLLVMIGVYIGFLENISNIIRYPLMSICCLVAWLIFLHIQKIAKTSWRISVEGQGQLRCQASSIRAAANTCNSSAENKPFNLVTGTTLWAHILFLRLQNQEDNVTINLVVFSDSLSKNEFRRLSAACKWIVAHAERVRPY